MLTAEEASTTIGEASLDTLLRALVRHDMALTARGLMVVDLNTHAVLPHQVRNPKLPKPKARRAG